MSTPIFYDLDGSLCSDERALEIFKNTEARRVDVTELVIAGRPVLVSTVFLIVNHRPYIWDEDDDRFVRQPGPPLLWLTEVIGGPDDIDGTQELYASRDEAIEGHALMIERMIASGCELIG